MLRDRSANRPPIVTPIPPEDYERLVAPYRPLILTLDKARRAAMPASDGIVNARSASAGALRLHRANLAAAIANDCLAAPATGANLEDRCAVVIARFEEIRVEASRQNVDSDERRFAEKERLRMTGALGPDQGLPEDHPLVDECVVNQVVLETIANGVVALIEADLAVRALAEAEAGAQ